MQLKGISCILLMIPISTAYIVHCEGEQTTLSCLDPRDYTEVKPERNALWKKGSGERVIWTYSGHSQKGDKFKNRTIHLNDNLTLTIVGCDLSDQGRYILCINGKQSCEVRLFVRDSKQCKPKTSSEQSTGIPAIDERKQAFTDEKNLQTETTNTYVQWVIYVSLCLVGLAIILLFVKVFCIPKEETSKNEKSESKLLHKDIYTKNNYPGA